MRRVRLAVTHGVALVTPLPRFRVSSWSTHRSRRAPGAGAPRAAGARPGARDRDVRVLRATDGIPTPAAYHAKRDVPLRRATAGVVGISSRRSASGSVSRCYAGRQASPTPIPHTSARTNRGLLGERWLERAPARHVCSSTSKHGTLGRRGTIRCCSLCGKGGRLTTDAWTELSGFTVNGGVRLAFRSYDRNRRPVPKPTQNAQGLSDAPALKTQAVRASSYRGPLKMFLRDPLRDDPRFPREILRPFCDARASAWFLSQLLGSSVPPGAANTVEIHPAYVVARATTSSMRPSRAHPRFPRWPTARPAQGPRQSRARHRALTRSTTGPARSNHQLVREQTRELGRCAGSRQALLQLAMSPSDRSRPPALSVAQHFVVLQSPCSAAALAASRKSR